jgi:UDP-glucuronate 4-epimerase
MASTEARPLGGPLLVTGGAGFIGSHLVDYLLRRGIETVVVDDFNDFYDPRIKRANAAAHLNDRRYRLVEGDIADGAMLERLFDEVPFTMVVHLAARAGVRPSLKDPLLYERTNGIGTLNLLECCRRRGVRDFVAASSSSVYGINPKVPFAEDDPVLMPISPYAATKRANELAAFTYHHLYGMNITMLRFFTVYGPRQRPEMAIHKFTRMVHEGREVTVFGDGSARRDYTYIDDILQGVVRSMEMRHPYEILNLGESQTIDLLGLIGLIEKALGKKARLNFLPPEPGDVPVTYADITKARRLLDYDPRTPIERGIPEFVQWFVKTQGGIA